MLLLQMKMQQIIMVTIDNDDFESSLEFKFLYKLEKVCLELLK